MFSKEDQLSMEGSACRIKKKIQAEMISGDI